MAAQVLMKRGKRTLATQIKVECCRQNGQQLKELLDFLLAPSRSIDDFETLDWCRWLIAGGHTFDEFSKTVRQYDNAATCGLVWTANFVAYRCRTCGVSPCMSLCSDCFQAGNHVGHDYNMFRSQAGGACDCGDVSVMNPDGFCPRHGPDRVPKHTHCPDDLLAVAETMLPKVFLRLLHHLRDSSKPEMMGTYQIVMQEAEAFLSFLHSLSDMGAAMRRVITQALTDEAQYKAFTQVEEKEDGSNMYYMSSQNNYQTAVSMMKHPERLEEYEDLPGLNQTLIHKCLLDELVFWMVKYEFPQKIVTLLLSLLPDDKYKEAFTRAFVSHYSRISLVLVSTIDRLSVANRVVHISVQLFSNELLSKKMADEQNLVYILVLSLTRMVEYMLSDSGLQDPDHYFHMVVDCGQAAMKDHCYWPIVSDLINLLTHKSIAECFMLDERLIKLWFETVTYFQGMNLNQRELTQHVEFEPDTYYAAFSAELEIAASPMWALASHCKDKSTAAQTKMIIRICLEALQDWFDAINCKDSTKPKPFLLTFHLPLHRHLAIFLVHAIQHQEVHPEAVLPSEKMLKVIMIHPLQIQVGVTEIYSGMWVRNGLQIKGQAMTYVQCHFCYSMVDADIYLLQVCASRLDPDYFVQTVLDRFHLQDWLTFTPGAEKSRYKKLTDEHQLSMVEGALCTLAMLQSIRTNLGMEEQELVRLEMATLLCVGDRTHSQLSDLMPEKSGMSGLGKELFEPTLKEISTYKAPNFEAGGGMQQGTYVPKEFLWEADFDPLHVFLRAVHRKDFQSAMDRYTEHLRQHELYKGKGSPWPPFRLPGPILSQYDGLRRLLHCKTLHGFLFTVLLKALREPTCTESILYFCIYLLELALTFPPVDATKKTTVVSDQVHDGQYAEWFPSNTISYNVRHVVKEVLVATPTGDESSAAVDMETSSLEEMFHLAPSSISSSGGPITSAYTGVMPSVSAAVAPPVTGDLRLAALKQSETKYESKGVSTDSLESNLSPVTINESIVSLLMKLHAKFSEKKCAYVPEKLSKRRRSGMAGSSSGDGATSGSHVGAAAGATSGNRVGDAAYFIEGVLDKIGRLNSECGRHVEEVYRDMCPKAETSKPGTSKTGSDQEEKRRKARQRQQKLMEQFASKQKAFMEQNMETEDLGEDASDSSSFVPKLEEKTYFCVICNQSSASTHERPMGLVVLLQATSVLGHRLQLAQPKVLNVGEGKRPPPRHTHCSQLCNSRLEKMLEHFEEAHCQMSVNIGWEGGVHVQSCGHYLHLDCHSSYVESLKTQLLSQNLNVAKGEYGCPLCRQLANSVISIVPQELSSLVKPVSHDPHQMVVDMGELMAKQPVTPGSSRLTKSMGSMMEDLTNTTYSIFKTFTKSPTSESVLLFVCSVARTNLELELLLRGGNLASPSAVSKKASFLPLVHVLGMHSKILISGPYTELWSHLTGVAPNEPVSNSVQPYRVGVPLLLKDMTSLLLQLVLTLPATIEKEHFGCLVQMLYNAVFVQSLAALSCKFTDEERAAWRTKGRNAKSSPLESLLSHVITRLECSRLYDDADVEMEHKIPAICQSVWSPHSVESNLQEHCLSFLRLAALLQYHLFSQDLPQLQPKQSEFQMLAVYLSLFKTASSPPGCGEVTTADCVHWVVTEPFTLTRAWTSDLVNFVNNHPSDGKSLLSTNNLWHGPHLMTLPHQYYKIFQHYRNKQCGGCSNVPKDPAICLVCGRYLCFKQACCSSQQQRTFECVEHSIECGAGTGIFLLVNSSVIVVVRGPRATLWGSVYLDEHGEEDRDLKRGKPLYLSEDRYRLLETQWLSHTFDHACKRWIWHQDRL